ncbi:hypothetical protein GCM10010912_17000 [Paenibacillus albidus]|uniref:Uncharacterized protein n=1 Tax=Paenibacillus albidus TaxID=2041023 RepID=A0A917C644_9BACL|nr:hypothetical protein [Paenibacillus albidus]GGF72470.1 hypothetical protein GCM10010912_17000 [Paenibacillus albidus]
MEKTTTMDKKEITHLQLPEWHKLAGATGWSGTFRIDEPGYAEITLLARSDSHWSLPDKESVLLTLEVDGEYNQTVVLFYGEEPFAYTRLLGRLEVVEHQLQLSFSEDSSPLAKCAWIKGVKIAVIPEDTSLGLIYRHAPVLYGRNLQDPFESRYTDTPLLLIYRMEDASSGKLLEYHTIYSHEDAGTPAPLLMSKWGRLTDIEWTYRVLLDKTGEVVKAEYQAPHHETKEFAGLTALGGHPVLQSATDNGMVTDVPVSSYRFLLPPVYHWKPEVEPRERAMDEYPFTYQLMAWELLRQEAWERPCNPDTIKFTDPRHYLYVQTSAQHEAAVAERRTSIDIKVKRRGEKRWYSSSFNDCRANGQRAAYDGPYPCFATTVKMPEGCSLEELEEVRVVLLPGGADEILVKGLKLFYLTELFTPGEAVELEGSVNLTVQVPERTIWKADAAYVL